jgi:hypothetical protein
MSTTSKLIPDTQTNAAKALARALMEDPLNARERRILMEALRYVLDGTLARRRSSSPGQGHEIKTESTEPGSNDTSLAA